MDNWQKWLEQIQKIQQCNVQLDLQQQSEPEDHQKTEAQLFGQLNEFRAGLTQAESQWQRVTDQFYRDPLNTESSVMLGLLQWILQDVTSLTGRFMAFKQQQDSQRFASVRRRSKELHRSLGTFVVTKLTEFMDRIHDPLMAHSNFLFAHRLKEERENLCVTPVKAAPSNRLDVIVLGKRPSPQGQPSQPASRKRSRQ